MEIKNILKQLRTERPVFHSEADFQHALAWEIHHYNPWQSVRLEINLGIGKRAMVDILLRDGHTDYAIELKYKACKLDTICRGEEFHLLNHGAQDIRRYDFVKDICRLERFVNDHPSTIGYAIFPRAKTGSTTRSIVGPPGIISSWEEITKALNGAAWVPTVERELREERASS